MIKCEKEEARFLEALYWHYRREYSKIKAKIEIENNLQNLTTKSAEDYYREKIQELTTILREEY